MRRAVAVTGAVVDSDGKPVKGAYASVYSGPTMHQGNQTKDDGALRLLVPADNPRPFRVVVQFRAGMKNASATAQNVVPGSSPFLRLPRIALTLGRKPWIMVKEHLQGGHP